MPRTRTLRSAKVEVEAAKGATEDSEVAVRARGAARWRWSLEGSKVRSWRTVQMVAARGGATRIYWQLGVPLVQKQRKRPMRVKQSEENLEQEHAALEKKYPASLIERKRLGDDKRCFVTELDEMKKRIDAFTDLTGQSLSEEDVFKPMNKALFDAAGHENALYGGNGVPLTAQRWGADTIQDGNVRGQETGGDVASASGGDAKDTNINTAFGRLSAGSIDLSKAKDDDSRQGSNMSVLQQMQFHEVPGRG